MAAGSVTHLARATPHQACPGARTPTPLGRWTIHPAITGQQLQQERLAVITSMRRHRYKVIDADTVDLVARLILNMEGDPRGPDPHD